MAEMESCVFEECEHHDEGYGKFLIDSCLSRFFSCCLLIKFGH